MALQSSGSIKIQDIVDEFGGSQPHSLSEYIRGGSRVPDVAQNSGVADSAAPGSNLSLGGFLGAVNAIIKSATSGENLDVSTLFGSDWSSNIPKELDIGSSTTIGSTDPNTPALIIASGMAGTLTIRNSGSIQGAGGNAGGGTGGNAILVDSTNVTLTNSGAIYAGGGGGGAGGVGGKGGKGGGGEVTTTETNYYYSSDGNAGTDGSGAGMGGLTSCEQVCEDYFNVSNATCTGNCDQINHPFLGPSTTCSSCRLEETVTNTTNTSGGSGGSGGAGGTGGRGKGYSQSATNGTSGGPGSAGANGGTNAGKGGTGGDGGAGGDGGSFGQSGDPGVDGANGSQGANGNRTNGLSGQSGTNGESGGAAGFAIANIGNLASYTNNGTVLGRT